MDIYSIEGHGCDTGEIKRIPSNCIYITLSECGIKQSIHSPSLKKFQTLFSSNHELLKDPVHNIKKISRLIGANIHVHYDDGKSEPNAINTYMENNITFFQYYDQESNGVSTSGLYKLGSQLSTDIIKTRFNELTKLMVEEIYNGSIYPTLDYILHEIPSYPVSFDTMIDIVHHYPLSYLFENFPGIYYNTVCRAPCNDDIDDLIDLRRKDSFQSHEIPLLREFKPMTKEELLEGLRTHGTYSSINYWDVSLITDMSFLFKDTAFNQDISDWDVSHVTNMESMFHGAKKFNQDLSKWNVSNVINMEGMFYDATKFNQDLSNWDVSHVTNMNYMFYRTLFNQDISRWNVSQVTRMSDMFYKTPFNQDISRWNVSQVTTMKNMFYEATKFEYDISNWDVSHVTNMNYMFYGTNFNQDISNWNVSHVTTMKYMFYDDYFFNQDLSNWNVSNVIDMENMFSNANSFQQSLENWKVSPYLRAFGANDSKITGLFKIPSFLVELNLDNCSMLTTLEFDTLHPQLKISMKHSRLPEEIKVKLKLKGGKTKKKYKKYTKRKL